MQITLESFKACDAEQGIYERLSTEMEGHQMQFQATSTAITQLHVNDICCSFTIQCI
jgi:hypothetical protein